MSTDVNNTDSVDIVKVVGTHTEDLYHVAEHLESTACAFFTTGNERVCKDLDGLAIRVRAAAKAIQDALYRHIDSEFKHAMSMSGTLLKTALAGIEIGKQKE